MRRDFMRKFLAAVLILGLLAGLAGCGSDQGEGPAGAGEKTEAENPAGTGEMTEAGETTKAPADASKILVAYFSWADNAVPEEGVDAISSPSVVAPGNVQQLAGWVQEQTGGELFPIRVTEPYPSGWDECLDRAHEERENDARPKLMETVEDMEQYEVVFLGYPNWWYGVPMAVLTFLEEHDLSGKQIYLFCSHGTGGLAESVDIITEAVPDSTVSGQVFDCYEEDAAGAENEISDWLEELGY